MTDTGTPSGKVHVEDGALKALADACDRYRGRLEGMKRGAYELKRADGYGGLNSAQTLGRKFADLGAGHPDSGISWSQLLDKRIDIAMAMRDQFLKTEEAYQRQDQAAAQALNEIGDQLDRIVSGH